MRKIWSAFLLGIIVVGCAAPPEGMRGTYSELRPREASSSNLTGQSVRWGGEIISTTPGKESTCFELEGRSLDGAARPAPSQGSTGRFIACTPGFYDPIEYAQGRELTVTGKLRTQGATDDSDRYPSVLADSVFLWPRRDAKYYYFNYNNDPLCGYWQGRWRGRCDYWPSEL